MSEENRRTYDLVIKNARVFDGSAVREGLSIGIAQNKISFVNGSAVFAAREIDAAGRFLMPGLIDCHVHLLNMWQAKDETTMANEAPASARKKTAAAKPKGAPAPKTRKAAGRPPRSSRAKPDGEKLSGTADAQP